MVDMSVKIGSVTLKNPIMPASGAFSTEVAQVMDINRLGALVTKTVSREYRIGNPPPRVAELEGGMINSIGLPGKGLRYFLEHQLPEYKRYTPPIVANITATTTDDFAAMAREVTLPEVDVIEMNISCPTREPGGGNSRCMRTTPTRSCAGCAQQPTSPYGRSSHPMPARSISSPRRPKRPAPTR